MVRTEKLQDGIEIPVFPEGYVEDGRMSVWELYQCFDRLEKEFDWIRETVYVQELPTLGGILRFPIEVYRTPLWGRAFWVFAGIHGEEPAGPNALALNIEALGELGKKIPVVVFPLCNPLGYFQDWRYPNEYRDKAKGHSVGDCEWLLPELSSFPPRPRDPVWSCLEAFYLPGKIVELTRNYPPKISINHHEDLHHEAPYIYSQGKFGSKDPIALEVVKILILLECGLPIDKRSRTDFGEPIVNGIVNNGHDSSIDELLVADKVIVNGEVIQKAAAEHAIVVETPRPEFPLPSDMYPLEKRIEAHSKIILSYPRFWQMANNW